MSKPTEYTHAEFGCSAPISFLTSQGIKTIQPGKIYGEALDELVKQAQELKMGY